MEDIELRDQKKSPNFKDETAVDGMSLLDEDHDGTRPDAVVGATVTRNKEETSKEFWPTKPPMVIPKRDYSDLEVVAVIPPSYGDARDKMPVLYDRSEKMSGMDGGSLLSPSVADPVPAYPVSIRTSTLSEVPLTKGGDYAEWEQGKAAQSTRDRRRLFGMSGRTLSFVAIGLMAFILILLATVLGITLTMKINQRARANAGVQSQRQEGILINSRLAALNWTDSSGTERSAVFYQDGWDSIMASLIDSVGNEWTQHNITAAIMNTTGASRLDVMSGTPLAAVTNKYQVSLYYFTTANEVAEIWASDIVGDVWYAGSLGSSLSPLRAMNGSSLAAQWQICNNCTYSLCVAFQEEDGNIQVANLTNSNWEFSGPVTADGSSVVNGTGLAVRPFTEDNATGTFGTDTNAWKIFSLDSTGLLEFQDGPANNFTWEEDSASE